MIHKSRHSLTRLSSLGLKHRSICKWFFFCWSINWVTSTPSNPLRTISIIYLHIYTQKSWTFPSLLDSRLKFLFFRPSHRKIIPRRNFFTQRINYSTPKLFYDERQFRPPQNPPLNERLSLKNIKYSINSLVLGYFIFIILFASLN